MYKTHFGLHTSPFALGTRLRFLFKSGAFEETMAHLVYGLKGGEDIVLITGGIGTGKTMALQNLIANISSLYRVALVNTTKINYKELLKMVLVELDISYPPEADKADLLMILKSTIDSAATENKRVLLIVDEAQNLDIDTLEGLRLLTNLSKTEKQALQLVLVGQPGLLENLDSPELVQLKQRIRVHYHLVTLTANEMKSYIEHRLKIAGCDKKLFSKGAYDKIFKLSKGVPRLVNVIADKSMLKAFVDKSNEVNVKHVEDLNYVSSENSTKETSSTKKKTVSAQETQPQIKPEVNNKYVNFKTAFWAIVAVAIAAGLYYKPWEDASRVEPVIPVVQKAEVIEAKQVDEKVEEQISGSEKEVADNNWPLPQSDKYWVQVGSFKVKENAKRLALTLEETGLNIAISISDLAGIQYYKVMCGPADTKDEAQDIAIKAKAVEGVLSATVKYVR